MQPPLNRTRVLILSIIAMFAFAGNSVLARLALGPGNIDAATFTLVRIASGAVMLWLLVGWRQRRLTQQNGRVQRPDGGNWPSATALFLYAICFSFAYLMLDTGTGALILFGAVQLTMVAWGLVQGERPATTQWVGWALALGGMIYLVFPGVSAPSPAGALLMATAGAAWGIYSLRGRGVKDPAQVTASNFLRAVPLAVVVAIAAIPWLHLTPSGAGLALLSGAFASGLGYTLWYYVLPEISATQAATCQLSVPLLAAVAGVLFVSEPFTLRLTVASVIILGGIGLAVLTRGQPQANARRA